jgi:outer membrane immunogenic protein
MSKFAFAAVAIMAAGVTAAQAADLPYRPRAPYTVNQPLNGYSWAGPYLGANLGYEWGSVSNSTAKPSGITGGVTGGYNWQSGQIVFGLEGDLQGTGASDTDRFANYKFSNPWFGTARGRIGYAFNNVLLYGTAGLSFGSLEAERNGLQQSQTSVGWTAGVGAEVGIYQNWTAKIEYLYVDLASNTYTLTGTNSGLGFSTVRVGVNYHF